MLSDLTPGLDEQAQALPDDGVVVGDHHRDLVAVGRFGSDGAKAGRFVRLEGVVDYGPAPRPDADAAPEPGRSVGLGRIPLPGESP